MTVLEAMSVGKPVVATDVGGIPKPSSMRRLACLFRPRNPGAFASALLRLASDPSLAGRMGEAARMQHRARFSIEPNGRGVRRRLRARARGAPIAPHRVGRRSKGAGDPAPRALWLWEQRLGYPLTGGAASGATPRPLSSPCADALRHGCRRIEGSFRSCVDARGRDGSEVCVWMAQLDAAECRTAACGRSSPRTRRRGPTAAGWNGTGGTSDLGRAC